MKGTWEQRQLNIGNEDFDFGEHGRFWGTWQQSDLFQGNKGTGTHGRASCMPWCLGQDVEFDCIGSLSLPFYLLYLIVSPFIRKELQLTFYANAATRPLHGRPCRDGEHIIEFHPQYLNKPETVTSTVESEHNKTKPTHCSVGPANFIISLGIRSVWSVPVRQKKVDISLTISCTAKAAGPGNSVRCVVRLMFRSRVRSSGPAK